MFKNSYKIIDLSLKLENNDSEANEIKIETLSHKEAIKIFGLEEKDFPDGIAISNEFISLTTHSGTHIDAPLHYGPLSGGKKALSVDQIDLKDCIGNAICLNVTNADKNIGITEEDIFQEFERQNKLPTDVDIVLLMTGSDKKWGTKNYFYDYVGLSKNGCEYLLRNGVRVIGIDAWGLDQPVLKMINDYKETGKQDSLWPVHVLGRKTPYIQIEKMTNLANLPQNGEDFIVSCFPIPISGSGGGWTRAVAYVENNILECDD